MFEDDRERDDITPSICQICGSLAKRLDTEWMLYEFDYEDSHPEGVPGDENELEAQLRWFSELSLLCDPDDEFGQLLPGFTYEGMFDEYVGKTDPEMPAPRPRSQASDIEIYPADPSKEATYWLEDPNGGCYASATVFWGRHETSDERVYVVTHAACLEIAKKVFESTRTAHVRDLRGLFMALRWRQGMARKCVDTFGTNRPAHPKVNYTLGNHNYYMPDCNWALEECPGMEWPGPYESARANLYYTLARHPVEIDDLTGCLLRNLQPCRSEVALSADSAKIAEGLARMPTEILDLIFFEMGSDLPRASSRLIPQRHWKEQLKAGIKGLLPWLWDVDADLVDQKDAEPCPGGEGFEWDWELLVRQLTRGVDYGIRPDKYGEKERNPDEQDEDNRFIWTTACTGFHTDLAHVPAGLHNRRRIWQLVEEMFVGDALPEPTLISTMARGRSRSGYDLTKDWVLLWWDKSGDLLPTPVWIPCINFFWPPSKDGYSDLGLYHVFQRRIGGEVFVNEDLYPQQYWQMKRGAGGGATFAEDEKGATVEEVYAVLRRIGYPV